MGTIYGRNPWEKKLKEYHVIKLIGRLHSEATIVVINFIKLSC